MAGLLPELSDPSFEILSSGALIEAFSHASLLVPERCQIPEMQAAQDVAVCRHNLNFRFQAVIEMLLSRSGPALHN